MAISRQKKEEIVGDLTERLKEAKLTVLVDYTGLNVDHLQQLRRAASQANVSLYVVKNRLFLRALATRGWEAKTDINGMMLYAFSLKDEVDGPQTIANFAKKQELDLPFVTGLTADGQFLEASEIKLLSKLPGRDQLIAGVIARCRQPLSQISRLGDKLSQLINALKAKEV